MKMNGNDRDNMKKSIRDNSKTMGEIKHILHKVHGDAPAEVRAIMANEIFAGIGLLASFIASLDEDNEEKMIQLLAYEVQVNKAILEGVNILEQSGISQRDIVMLLPEMSMKVRRALGEDMTGVESHLEQIGAEMAVVEFAQMFGHNGEVTVTILEDSPEELVQTDMFDGMGDWEIGDNDEDDYDLEEDENDGVIGA
jgi:hypothetical protein